MTDTPSDSQPDTINLLGLRLPWKATLISVLSTLLLIEDHYYDPTTLFLPHERYGDFLRALAYEHLMIYLVVPLLVIGLIFRERPSDYGFQLGDWRTGLKWTLAACVTAAPILYFAGRTPAMVEYYQVRYNQPLGEVALTGAMELFGWEFFFRGFILFGLYRIAGPSAVVLQAVPFAMAHYGKPPLETLSTIFGGTAFGWLAWRTRSFVYPFLIHWFVMTFVAWVAVALG